MTENSCLVSGLYFKRSGLIERSSNVRSSNVGPGCWAKKNESSIDNQFRKDPDSGKRSSFSHFLVHNGPKHFGPSQVRGQNYWSCTKFVDKINDKLPNEKLTIHRSPRWQKSYHRQLDQVEGSVTWFFNFWTHKRSLSRGRTQNQVLDPLPSSGTLHEDNRKRCCCIRHKNFWCSSIIFLIFDRLF